MRRLLEPVRPDPVAFALLVLAAVAVGVAGMQHARLFHRGYAEVQVVGVLFVLNAIGSATVVLALVFDRIWVFVLGALSICAPSLASIALSHSATGFVGFREGGYDPDALLIVAAEVGATVFALAGGAVAARGGSSRSDISVVARAPLAGVVMVAIGITIVGLGMGSSSAEREPTPDASAIAASRTLIATGGPSVSRGRKLFEDQGCDRCHSLAAVGANGKLGPRLDTLDEDLDDNLESIVAPREDTADGYPEQLMPVDLAARLDDDGLRALAEFVTVASSVEDDRDLEDGGGGQGGGNSGPG